MFPFSATLVGETFAGGAPPVRRGSMLDVQPSPRSEIPADFEVDPRFGPATRHIWRIVNAFDVDLHKGPVQLEQQSVDEIMV